MLRAGVLYGARCFNAVTGPPHLLNLLPAASTVVGCGNKNLSHHRRHQRAVFRENGAAITVCIRVQPSDFFVAVALWLFVLV